ncbi:unnamed protein product [Clavelina lepadiformis]|uniref:Sodefrin-like factor n=1 Tax=Clavelina lepadiformis TaxID=159417 RepID=A0ABP0FG71_CLALP
MKTIIANAAILIALVQQMQQGEAIQCYQCEYSSYQYPPSESISCYNSSEISREFLKECPKCEDNCITYISTDYDDVRVRRGCTSERRDLSCVNGDCWSTCDKDGCNDNLPTPAKTIKCYQGYEHEIDSTSTYAECPFGLNYCLTAVKYNAEYHDPKYPYQVSKSCSATFVNPTCLTELNETLCFSTCDTDGCNSEVVPSKPPTGIPSAVGNEEGIMLNIAKEMIKMRLVSFIYARSLLYSLKLNKFFHGFYKHVSPQTIIQSGDHPSLENVQPKSDEDVSGEVTMEVIE